MPTDSQPVTRGDRGLGLLTQRYLNSGKSVVFGRIKKTGLQRLYPGSQPCLMMSYLMSP